MDNICFKSLESMDNKVKVKKLSIDDVIVFEPRVFGDDRGFFLESFNHKVFEEVVGHATSFVQDNHSKSIKSVLRGLHYQLPPKAQGKLVRVVSGEIFDVAVDIRKNSPTYGKWVGEILSAENCKQLWIPEGFAHGFMTLSSSAEVLYKTTDYYSPSHERSIRWDDPDLKIDWKFDFTELTPFLSGKDKESPFLKDAEVF